MFTMARRKTRFRRTRDGLGFSWRRKKRRRAHQRRALVAREHVAHERDRPRPPVGRRELRPRRPRSRSAGARATRAAARAGAARVRRAARPAPTRARRRARRPRPPRASARAGPRARRTRTSRAAPAPPARPRGPRAPPRAPRRSARAQRAGARAAARGADAQLARRAARGDVQQEELVEQRERRRRGRARARRPSRCARRPSARAPPYDWTTRSARAGRQPRAQRRNLRENLDATRRLQPPHTTAIRATRTFDILRIRMLEEFGVGCRRHAMASEHTLLTCLEVCASNRHLDCASLGACGAVAPALRAALAPLVPSLLRALSAARSEWTRKSCPRPTRTGGAATRPRARVRRRARAARLQAGVMKYANTSAPAARATRSSSCRTAAIATAAAATRSCSASAARRTGTSSRTRSSRSRSPATPGGSCAAAGERRVLVHRPGAPDAPAVAAGAALAPHHERDR